MRERSMTNMEESECSYFRQENAAEIENESIQKCTETISFVLGRNLIFTEEGRRHSGKKT